MNEMVIIIRPSFKKICGPDACRAAVYNHILYRLARKAKDEPEEKVKKGEVFWFASAEDICKDMDNAWCVNKIRKEVKVLFESGILGQRHNPLKKWDRKFQYFVSEEQGVKLLEKCKETGVCLMHLGLNAEVLHLLFMVNAFDKYGGCKCQKEEMDTPNMVDAITKYGRAIPKGSTKGSSEEPNQEESTDASALASAAHTPFQQEQAEQIRIATSEQEKRGQDEYTDLASHSSNHQHRAESHRDRTENLGLGTQQQEVSEVTQANHVAAVPSGRAKEVPAEEQKTPPRPRRTPPVHKDAQPEKQSNLLDCPLTEPDMSGVWNAEKCVQYAEWCNGKRYKDAIRPKQVEAARKLHREDEDVTVAQFKLAYDDWKRWWDEKGKGSMHVSDLMVKQDNGFLRYQNALERLATAANKKPKTTTTGDKPRASVLVSEEQAKKNMDKMRANVAAKQAALAASGK